MEGHSQVISDDLKDVLTRLAKDGQACRSRFMDTRAVTDIEQAIEAFRRGVQLTSEVEDPYLQWWLGILADSLYMLFEHAGRLSSLDEAISVGMRAAQLPSHSDETMTSVLNNLQYSFNLRFQRTGNLSDVSESILYAQRCIQRTPVGDRRLPTRLHNLGLALLSRFEATGDLTDVSEAIPSMLKAVDLTPEGDPELPNRLHSLGGSFRARFGHTGDLKDIDESIAKVRKALELAPQDHADLPTWLDNIGQSFHLRFKRLGNLPDLTECISYKQRALEHTPDTHADLPGRLNNLGMSFLSRFQHTSDLSDLSEAISLEEKSVRLTPEGHPKLPIRLNNLGMALQTRFERTGGLSDLSEAISFKQRAVHLAPKDYMFLNSLGLALMIRFQRSANLADLAEAISSLQNAVHLTPEGHSDVPAQLSNLGSAYHFRFERTSSPTDLAEAIVFCQKAVEVAPKDHASLPVWLSNLAGSLESRFERTDNFADLTEVISYQRRAVQLTPENHTHYPTLLNHLGRSLRRRFNFAGSLADLDEAVSLCSSALEKMPLDHGGILLKLKTLATMHMARFDHTRNMPDLAQAIGFAYLALKKTPETHPGLPSLLCILGKCVYKLSMQHPTNPAILGAAMSHFKAAATATLGPPRTRLDAAVNWARLLHLHSPVLDDVLMVFDTAIELVALITGLDQTVQLRYVQLQDIAGLPLMAASAACALNRPEKALEWLEQGRCLVWSQLTNLRTPIDELQAHDSDLAQRVTELSLRLQSAGSTREKSRIGMSLPEKISLDDEARSHLSLALQWDDLVATVRDISGFGDFLKPSPCSTLLSHLPDSGYVIVINIEDRRCDAIALHAGCDKPIHIPLPNFSSAKANQYRSDLTNELRSQQLRDRGTVEVTDSVADNLDRGIRPAYRVRQGKGATHNVLGGLWIDIVKPILNELNISKNNCSSPATILPRIWWCPTGPLSFLPIHAAGLYGTEESESIHDYTVSSYTPTVTALTDRVRKSHSIDKSETGLFLTSQPNAPGTSPIVGTKQEVRSIHDMAIKYGVKVVELEGDAVDNIDTYIRYMESCTSVHLACHASQNSADPLESRFLFHNGTLDLGTIIQKNLKNADLAFLSACQTSTGEEKLSDEAVHLAAGMLSAGYRRVVATMWSIGDRHAPQVATDFYQYLWKDSEDGVPRSGGFDGTNSAYALHHAIQELRLRLGSNSEQALLAWVPYVHFGY
ncbi:hypothetical protein D9611_011732 [Ephemerocybe angulata]|uniref:CHAT domain-containing protein n=1 Tax=Ephemerocybe angulata TaxID=980116 RepID=A0A8H5FG53_9AGAR|nr:hypothetical protein D9611_011732 [Tulosesus angulatus]